MAAATLTAGAASAAAPDPDDAYRSHLSGDWHGWRTRLAERGLDVAASYRTGFWSNLRGGFETGIRYDGFARWGAVVDLERLAGWSGARFHVDWHSYHGGEPSAELIGAFPTKTVDAYEAASSVRFYHLYLEQLLFSDKLQIKLGQLAADDDFFQSAYAGGLQNGAFGNFSREGDEQFSPYYPLAAPGVYVEARPWKWVTLRGAAYVAGVGEDEKSNWGFDWSFDEGATLFGETNLHWSAGSLPGVFEFGAFATTAEVTDFDDDQRADGTWAIYTAIDQALWRDAAGETRLGAFLRNGVSPQPDRASIEWYVQCGFQLDGPLPGRGRDALMMGMAYTHFADAYMADLAASGERASGRSVLLEVSYRTQVTPWLQLVPSLQVFFKPHFSRRNALAFGVTAVITL